LVSERQGQKRKCEEVKVPEISEIVRCVARRKRERKVAQAVKEDEEKWVKKKGEGFGVPSPLLPEKREDQKPKEESIENREGIARNH